MGMRSKVAGVLTNLARGLNGSPPKAGIPTRTPASQHVTARENAKLMRARFELSFTTNDNVKRWELADMMSVDAAASWMVRRTLRMRSRQEYHNNGLYFGMIDTQANYVIGSGPKLQMLTDDQGLNDRIEEDWEEWQSAVDLTEKLKNTRAAENYNGEAFALLRTNPKIESDIKLDYFPIEADQVSSPYFGQYPAQYPDQYFDGVMLDPWGNPNYYNVLRQHPGAFGAFVIMGYEFDTWAARNVIHAYRKIRPGQQRGIPQMLQALPILVEIRAYLAAVRAAAETAADVAGIVSTEAPAGSFDENGGSIGPDLITPGDTFEIPRRSWLGLPANTKVNQLKAEQPTTLAEMFVNLNLREAARPINMPLFIASMDASGLNMSVAYVLTQPFIKAVQGDRDRYNQILDRKIFPLWVREWSLARGFVQEGLPKLKHTWRWDEIAYHADPQKSAEAVRTRLQTGTSSFYDECAAKGRDYNKVLADNARAVGLTVEEFQKLQRESLYTVRGTVPPDASAPSDVAPDPAAVGNSGEEDDA